MAENTIATRAVVIGGSAGSLEVLLKLVPNLPVDSDAVFIVVVHRKNDPDSILQLLFESRTAMKVKEVEDKEPIEANTIYIAPPDYHLLLEDDHNFSLDSSEKINYSRPSIDVTFESVAEIFGERSIGVLLSGANSDGALGLDSIKKAGGYAIVQHPESAEVDFMPMQAININAYTVIERSGEIAQIIADQLKLI